MQDELAAWNDAMYKRHPTPYGRGIAGAISTARVKTVKRPASNRRVGADISVAALEDARALAKRVGAERIEFIQLNAEEPLPFARGEFDVIVISEMLEHVERPRLVLERVHAITTAATRVVITVPNERPKLVIKSVLQRLRLFDLLFPGIEEGQSEWHLQQFSKPMIRTTVKDLFAISALESVWGAHYAALLRRIG
jgi:ubiquinone/menaquinone biosynthesis C-methylase UbiE